MNDADVAEREEDIAQHGDVPSQASRRRFGFLRAVAMVGGLITAQPAFAQQKGSEITNIVSNEGTCKLSDAEGNKYSPAEAMKGKSYILVFGRHDECKQCDLIAANLSEVKKEKGKDMPPILYIEVKPGADKETNKKYEQEVKERYKKAGIEDITVQFPAKRDQAVALQNALKGGFDSQDEDSHIRRIAIVDKNGICVDNPLGDAANSKEKILAALKAHGISR